VAHGRKIGRLAGLHRLQLGGVWAVICMRFFGLESVNWAFPVPPTKGRAGRSNGASERMTFFLPTRCLQAQESSVRRTDRNVRPRGMSEYSTRTGISAWKSRLTRPSRSSCRNCSVSTFGETRGILSRSSLKRRGSWLSSSHQRITGFHRPPMKANSSSTGHKLALCFVLIDLSLLETRYPFGSWYPPSIITRIFTQSSRGEQRGAPHET
jgi:hypothetical protein